MPTLPILPAHPTCRLCPLHENVAANGHVGVPSIWLPSSLPPGSTTKPLVLVGMNPGAVESKANEPFLGPSGKVIRNVLLQGWKLPSLASIYLSNVARCISPGTTPADADYNACLPYLLDDLRAIYDLHQQPLTVLLLGADPVRILYRRIFGPRKGASLRKAASNPRTEAVLDAIPLFLFATVHPAYILRNRPAIHTASDHFALLVDHLTDRWVSPSSPNIIEPTGPSAWNFVRARRAATQSH